MSNLLKSPKGNIQFMAVENPVKQSKASEKLVYTIKLAIDPKDDKDNFLGKVAEVNDAKVVTERTYRGKDQATKDLLATGKVLVSANSTFKPEIYDAKGNKLETAPMFFSDSTGVAQMIVQPWTGEKGGTINLVAVKIHSVEQPEGSTSGGKSREARAAELRALAEKG